MIVREVNNNTLVLIDHAKHLGGLYCKVIHRPRGREIVSNP